MINIEIVSHIVCLITGVALGATIMCMVQMRSEDDTEDEDWK